MKNEYQDARQWRERARQLRLLAKQMTHPKARNDLAEIVERWEQAARGAEVRLRLVRRAEGKRQPQGELR
ncbi:MAG: hypothetical protein JNL04_02040 [Rhodospirillaceae bacterium]|nr:hypothetical protein [Rhodospirillaceae bacterium]